MKHATDGDGNLVEFFWAKLKWPGYEGWEIVRGETSPGDFTHYDILGSDQGVRAHEILERGPVIEIPEAAAASIAKERL